MEEQKLSTELAKLNKHGSPVGGGCCIWYDERNLLGKVEERLKQSILPLGDDLSLPDAIAKQNTVYGEVAHDGSTETSAHIAALAPTVEDLSKLKSNRSDYFTSSRCGG